MPALKQFKIQKSDNQKMKTKQDSNLNLQFLKPLILHKQTGEGRSIKLSNSTSLNDKLNIQF